MKTSFIADLDPKSKYVLIRCLILFSGNGMITMILGSLLPMIRNEHALSDTVSGFLLSSHQIGQMSAVFLAGILPFYLGRKRVLLSGVVFAITGLIIMTVTGSPPLLIFAFAFTGLARGTISNFCNFIVNELSDGKAGALNLLHGIFAIGALVSPLFVILGVQVAGDKGWRIAAWIIAAFLTMNVFLFLRTKIADFTREQRQKLTFQFLKKKSVWYHIGALFFYAGAEATIIGWSVAFFVDIGIMPSVYAQILATVLWMAILAGRFYIVLKGGSLANTTILLMATSAMAVFYAAMLLSRNAVLTTLMVAALGFSMAGIFPTLVASSGKTMREYPASFGSMMLIGLCGAITMPSLVGIMSDYFGLFIGMSSVIVAVLFLLLFVLLIRQRTAEE